MPRALGVVLALTLASLSATACSSGSESVTVTKTHTVGLAPEREPTIGFTEEGLHGLTPLNGLVPEDGKPLDGWRIPPSGGIGARALVQWIRMPSANGRSHLSLWQLVSTRDRWSRWRRIWRHDVEPSAALSLRRGDVDGDGHEELVIMMQAGSGGCGPRFVLATDKLPARQLFSQETCDSSLTVEDGLLVEHEGAYTVNDSHCCPTFRRKTERRWNGQAFVVARTSLHFNCNWARCARWPRGPLQFVPTATAFWKSGEGIAVGGKRPWLIARTSDGGRSWRIEDAMMFPLSAPRLLGPGRAIIRFTRCDSECRKYWPARAATTRDYGSNWETGR